MIPTFSEIPTEISTASNFCKFDRYVPEAEVTPDMITVNALYKSIEGFTAALNSGHVTDIAAINKIYLLRTHFRELVNTMPPV
jgi:hypothetical protein